jgi:SPX domain protein involved in polyphosphate accumulation
MYINFHDYLLISGKLKHLAHLDKNSIDNNGYKIRSLYFDNYLDKAVIEKLSGQSQREKFRIRLYNDDPSYIHLEKKSKSNRLCYKVKCAISQNRCERLIAGEIDVLKEMNEPLALELYSKMHTQALRPRVIVDYIREAYIYEPGNVRITFDRDICSSQNIFGLFDSELVTIPAAGSMIMEVKYDGFLPEPIWQLIQVSSRHERESSKYLVSRLV